MRFFFRPYSSCVRNSTVHSPVFIDSYPQVFCFVLFFAFACSAYLRLMDPRVDAAPTLSSESTATTRGDSKVSQVVPRNIFAPPSLADVSLFRIDDSAAEEEEDAHVDLAVL